ncbi:M3 family oligoendopeptidase [Tissierella pigra]|uniref:M3 family oligoendopeptidase n=1 Tax=Tissierella pigra TaxID=2607614 RepID=A0A6N7XY75_9FIRM|nr:M3 family oligoendopeptidase [Tissierella pigra]MBU5425210.1 M3 family oligoendopeptidase [Tissierella pigra]MSU02767.1 M3 family oligoendopeptidase [Tissierella pigra]
MRWSLKELYTSFDSKEFISDLEKLDCLIVEYSKWADENLGSSDNTVEKTEKYIEYSRELNSLFSKLSAFAHLTNTVEAKNEDALKYLDRLRVKGSDLTKPDVQFQNFVKDIDNLEEIINSSELLKEHKFYLEQIKDKTKYMLSEKEEVLISKMSNTGSSAWSNLQNMVSSTLMVDINIDGENKQLPFPAARNLAYDKDPAKRKAGYEAELKAYKKIEESSAAALNGIKGEVITTSALRGYNSPLEETLVKSRMDEETLNAMLTAMREFLPVFHKYYRKKAELLGYSDGLPFYEMFAPMGEVNRTFTYDEAMDYIIKNFRTFSDKLADFVENAHKNNWLDVEPREGKRGGAFCSNLHPIKESRILSNFNGSFSNMTTLAHELGHGYHGLNLKDESILNSRYPMPIAETASIFCETIVVNAALKEASDEEALSILESSISDAGQVIVDIYSRFLFESELFERRKTHALSVNELKEIMMDAQKEAYGNGLDHSILHPYMWLNKPHYYSAGLNFYNFPYAFGLLFSKGLYAEYLKRGEEFIKEYDELLNATGKNNIKDVALRMNIDVHDPEFFRNSLRLIEKDIEKFIELASK